MSNAGKQYEEEVTGSKFDDEARLMKNKIATTFEVKVTEAPDGAPAIHQVIGIVMQQANCLWSEVGRDGCKGEVAKDKLEAWVMILKSLMQFLIFIK